MDFFKSRHKASHSYEEMLKTNLTDMDYFKLRVAYTNSNYYDPYGSGNEIRELSNLYEEGKYQEIIKKASDLIITKFVNIDFHIIVFSAAKRLNDEELLSFHGSIANNLMDSILNSGDGKTPENAYIVISTDEEYALLDRLNLKMKTQSLIKVDERNYDLLQVVDEEGNQTEIYFNIDLPYKWLDSKMK